MDMTTTTIIKFFYTFGRRATLFLLLIYLCSCNKTNRWSLDHVRSDDCSSDSSKLSFHAPDRVNGIDLEILQLYQSGTQKTLHLYLNVHASPIPPFNNHPKEALVTIIIDENKHSFIAHRREGGQRVLLPDASHSLIIGSLKEKKAVTIQLQGYITEVDPSQLLEKFNKMQKQSFYRQTISIVDPSMKFELFN